MVSAAGTTAIATGDVYNLLEAIPPRWQGSSVIAGSSAVLDLVYRLTPSGSTSEPQMMPDRAGALLGRRVVEWSSMAGSVSTAGKVLVAGDIGAAYTIVDRVGMSIELVPHLFGTANLRPVGMRGLYAYWRNSAGVVNANAVRVLKMK